MRIPSKLLSSAAVVTASALLLASCSSGGSSSSSPTTTASGGSNGCTPSALNAAKGPVQVNFWESALRANATVATQLVNQFNASQSKVHVNLIAQTSYADTWQKIQAGLTNNQLPDLAMLTDTDTQAAIDTQAFQPVQSCWNGFKYSPGDMLPRALSFWKVKGTQWAQPWAVSGLVLYYNKQAFAKAGIANPPTTLAELSADASKLKSAGQGGMGLKIDPWQFQTWLATANQPFVNNDNGRSARATAVTFNNATGLGIFKELSGMVKDGSTQTNSWTGSDVYNNLLGVGSGKFSMTIDTSAALGTIESLLPNYPNVTMGVAPFPTAVSNATGGVFPAGAGLWISKKSSAATQAAAWEFTNFLTNTESVTTWASGTGYIPIRTSSANSPTMTKLYAANPGYKVAYTQLLSGPASPATTGPVLGPFDTVNTAITNAENALLINGTAPQTALTNGANASNQIITSYNQRVGG